jgi:hypothetical protein
MTDLKLPNRSHIFSPALILLQLALYRFGLSTMVFADDVVLLGRPPSASPEPAPADDTFQAAGLVRARTGAPSPPPRSSLGAEPSLGAPVRAEVDAAPRAIFPLAASRLGRRTISAAILLPSWRAPRRLTAAMLPGAFGKHTCGTASPGLVHLSCTALWRPLPVTPRPWCSLQRPRLYPYLLTIAGKFVYYESIKRGLKRRLIYEYRCDERLKTKNEESTRLSDTGLVVELEHLKTKTRLKDEKFASVKGECET